MLNSKSISSTSPFFQLTNIQPSSSTILLASLLGLAVFLSIIPSQLTAEAQQTSQNLIQLPVGEVVFKIEVSEEGIYEISAADLINEGMNSGVNPADIQVIHNGQEVAWELVADGASQSNVFDGNDKIRFYGWPFDESRDEKLFVNNNVYWIIPGRTAKQVQTSGSFGETLPAITSVPATIQLEFDDHFDSMHMLEVDWERVWKI